MLSAKLVGVPFLEQTSAFLKNILEVGFYWQAAFYTF
jgi:hypothetical protein